MTDGQEVPNLALHSWLAGVAIEWVERRIGRIDAQEAEKNSAIEALERIRIFSQEILKGKLLQGQLISETLRSLRGRLAFIHDKMDDESFLIGVQVIAAHFAVPEN